MNRRMLFSLSVAIACACWTPAAIAQQSDASTARQLLAQPPLRSRSALEAYLRSHANEETPLDLLPRLARKRFLDSLVFGRNGLGGFGTQDLAIELTTGEVERVLALFDAASLAGIVKSRHPTSPPRWRGKLVDGGKAEACFDELDRISEASPDKHELPHRFESLCGFVFQSPEGLSGLSERDLIYLLRAAGLVSFYMPTPELAGRIVFIVTAMEAKGTAKPQDVREAYDALLQSRRFDDARRYALERPNAGLPATPKTVDTFVADAPALSVWQPGNDGATLEREAFDPQPTQILVTAGCHFSEDAAEAISKDPVLGPIFAKHAHWLLLPPGWEDQEAVREWNHRFPDARATQIYDREEWTFLPDGWSMPTFFFMRNGKVLEQISGWGSDPTSNRKSLLKAMARSGLIPKTELPTLLRQGAVSSSR